MKRIRVFQQIFVYWYKLYQYNLFHSDFISVYSNFLSEKDRLTYNLKNEIKSKINWWSSDPDDLDEKWIGIITHEFYISSIYKTHYNWNLINWNRYFRDLMFVKMQYRKSNRSVYLVNLISTNCCHLLLKVFFRIFE